MSDSETFEAYRKKLRRDIVEYTVLSNGLVIYTDENGFPCVFALDRPSKRWWEFWK